MKISKALDLGLDVTRIKDQNDARRQEVTVQALLDRMFHASVTKRQEVQILADEVGMGKTFVALGAAFSILEAMRSGEVHPDLSGSFQKILVITPPNGALRNKWQREVEEFVKRCVPEAKRPQAKDWFRPQVADRLDDVVRALRKPGQGGRIVVTKMTAFGGDKLWNLDVKRRYLLGALFRYWGNGFRVDDRERLLRGAPEWWPNDPSRLAWEASLEATWLPFGEADAIEAIGRLDHPSDDGQVSPVEELRLICRELGQPYARDREAGFRGVTTKLNWLYREITLASLQQAIPMVIVDEAHNWKNGPDGGSNGYEFFEKYIAPRTRRLLMLTATPFQLRPEELLSLVRIGEACQLAPERSGSADRRARLLARRKELEVVVERASASSSRLAKAWARLDGVHPAELARYWDSKAFRSSRSELDALARDSGAASVEEVKAVSHRAVRDVDPRLRGFLEAALVHFANQRDLTHELAPLIIRHRRRTDHRVFKVGSEYALPTVDVAKRSDRNALHQAPGVDVVGDGALPHYLLMRCVTEAKGGHGRSALGSALTGCWSTLFESSEGDQVRKRLAGAGRGRVYLDVLEALVDPEHDETHPKVRLVADEVLRRWHAGEKSLIFCFRVNTAERLRDIIDRRIRAEFNERRRRCLGSEGRLASLRQRLTTRNRELMPVMLDRVLWSLFFQPPEALGKAPFRRADLDLRDTDLVPLARAALEYGVDVAGERPDRLFLDRAVQHVVAQRLLRTAKPGPKWKAVLERIASQEWVERQYGVDQGADGDDAHEDGAVDERGVQHAYSPKTTPTDAQVEELAERLRLRRQRARQGSLLDVAAEGPSIWFGGAPSEQLRKPSRTVVRIHQHLNGLTFEGADGDWEGRLLVMQALRRLVLRESVLVRTLPETSGRGDQAWDDLIVRSLHAPMAGQREAMADRLEVYLEDLRGAGGDLTIEESPRGALLAASRLRDQKFVALVKGGDQATRERVFTGFNTPLLPEILVCTSVGAEGIDLHRHCRHVVHYDLAWNPAVLEQRTGRVDRIGSKTFRERVGKSGLDIYLEVGVPYLAGTYDERMYEELRLRAQRFEVLTGGDLAADGSDHADGADERKGAEGKALGMDFVPLPVAMLEDLRVKLHVWPSPDHVKGH